MVERKAEKIEKARFERALRKIGEGWMRRLGDRFGSDLGFIFIVRDYQSDLRATVTNLTPDRALRVLVGAIEGIQKQEAEK